MSGNCDTLPLKEYDARFTADFVAQTETIPDATPVARFIVDASELRAAVRACKGG